MKDEQITIDYRNFDGVALASDNSVADETLLEATRIDANTMRLESKTTASSFMYFRIPGPLPVGSKVELIAEVRYITGLSSMLLGLDSYTDATYGGNNGLGDVSKVIEDNVQTPSDPQFKEYRVNYYVRPGNQYARATVGFFNAKIGIAEVRNIRVVVTGSDVATVRPQTTPVTARQAYDIRQLDEQWVSVVDGTGTLVRNASSTDMVGNFASRAYVRLSAINSDVENQNQAFHDIEGSKGFTIRVTGTRNSGWPGIYVDYFDSVGVAVETLRCYFTGGTDETQDFWFPAIPDAADMRPAIGFFTTNEGDFELQKVEIIQHDAPTVDSILGIQPICATIKKDSGTWQMDDESITDSNLRFKASIIDSVTDNTTYLTVNFKANSVSGRPTILAQVNEFSSGSQNYYCAPDGVTNTGFNITFRSRTTQAVVNTATVANNTFVTCIGMAVR